MGLGIDSIIQAFSKLFGKLSRNAAPAPLLKLAFSEHDVRSSLNMASMALEQKSSVIHALQLKLSDLSRENSMPNSSVNPRAERNDSYSATPTTPLSDDDQGIQRTEVTVALIERLNCATERAELAEEELQHTKEQLCLLQQQMQEQKLAVAELAHMLAAREASQAALVEMVQEFLSQQMPSSFPTTPRDTNCSVDSHSKDGTAPQRFESMLSCWQKRLQEQTHESVTALKETYRQQQTANDGDYCQEENMQLGAGEDDVLPHGDSLQDVDRNNNDNDDRTPPTTPSPVFKALHMLDKTKEVPGGDALAAPTTPPL